MIRTAALALTFAYGYATEVNVMLGLDTVTDGDQLKDKGKLGNQMDQLKSANVDGVMMDVWWGLTEKSPKSYNFDVYKEIVQMAKDRGLKVQVVTSFHQCGGNVGDACNIPLPSFVTGTQGIWYKDQWNHEDKEYISLFADGVKIGDRSPMEMYADWFAAFAAAFKSDLGSTINELQIGMGPAGELRYPAYQLSQWSFCGVGAFQVWDEHALASFKGSAIAAGHPEWNSPPTDAGNYNSKPDDTSFFKGGYKSEYGEHFLDWYFGALKVHGHSVLAAARLALGDDVMLAAKVSGIHWWYNTDHHAAELTAGYYNANSRNAYAELADVLKSHGAALDFTCLEMRDREQSSDCKSGPEELVRQVAGAASGKGVTFNGENALPRYDDTAYDQIESYRNGLHSFTYLRLGEDLLNGDNFGKFKNFVNKMHNGAASSSEQIV